VPKLPHTGTIESLLALSPDEAYPRTAAWLATASEEEIQAFWEALSKTDDPASNRHDIVDLTFLNWARLNPQGAIAIVKGGPYEHFAWWAWSAYDPAGAVAAASAENMDRLRNVTWGLGEFQPQWLREHYNDLPAEARDNAFGGLEKWGDAGHPAEMLSFLAGLGRFDNKTFLAWVQQDPLAAYDWLSSPKGKSARNSGGFFNSNENAQLTAIVDTLSDTDPGTLQRLIDRAPKGDQKRRLESLAFQKLLGSDPDAAMQQAQETKSPRVAAERLAAVGSKLIQSDPDQALSVMRQILTTYPSALQDMTWVEFPEGGRGDSQPVAGMDAITAALLDRSPGELLTMAAQIKGGQRFQAAPFDVLASSWAQRDLEGFGNWVNQQTDPAISKPAINAMVQQLSNRSDFQEAAQWAQTLNENDAADSLRSLMYNWGDNDPDNARSWLQTANLPQTTKDAMAKIIDQMNAKKQ